MADDEQDVTGQAGPILRGDVVAARLADATTPPQPQPAPPQPPVGAHPAREHRCDAPGCVAMTPFFVATSDVRVIHWCDAHEAWAMREAKVKGWWRE